MNRQEARKVLIHAEQERTFSGGEIWIGPEFREAVRIASKALKIDIIQCKDCEYSYQSDRDFQYKKYNWFACSEQDDIIHTANFYCAMAKRRVKK